MIIVGNADELGDPGDCDVTISQFLTEIIRVVAWLNGW